MFVRSENPIWSFVDLNGKQCDDTFYLFTLTNTIPYIPQPIWQDPQGMISWSDPIQFFANGTLPDNMYWDPTLVYRLEIRQGPTQSDPLIYLIENYVPIGNGGSGGTSGSTTDNQITNPQFAFVNFSSPVILSSISLSTPYPVAPGWFITGSGTGNLTIAQTPISSTTPTPTNAPYALDITSSGAWASLVLYQSFVPDGQIWGSTDLGGSSFVSASITMVSLDGTPHPVMVNLVPSVGSPTNIISDTMGSVFQQFSDVATIPQSTNTDVPPAGNTQLQIILPTNGHVSLTSIQVLNQSSNDAAATYQQTTTQRQIDQTFNYYQQPLFYKPISSYLVGWDFPMNPAQFGISGNLSAVGANKAAYAWDQTIILQTSAAAIAYNEDAGGKLVVSATSNTQFALIQYVETTKTREILLQNLSVMVSALSSSNTSLNISLWYTTNVALPAVTPPTYDAFVTSLDVNGHPSGTVPGWTELPRVYKQNAQFTTTSFYDTVGFNGWESIFDSSNINNNTFFAIVVGTPTVSAGNSVTFSSVSLVPGDIPTIPAPQRPDEVLRECELYFERTERIVSVPVPINPLTFIQDGAFTSIGTTRTLNLFSEVFQINYRVQKLTIPIVTVFSPVSGSSDTVSGYAMLNGVLVASGDINLSSNWSPTAALIETPGVTGICFFPTNGNTLISGSGVAAGNISTAYFIALNYTADSRLGSF